MHDETQIVGLLSITKTVCCLIMHDENTNSWFISHDQTQIFDFSTMIKYK
jgi:hypothetical protein